jgi:predicted ArsR family transcriptional regulator
MNELVGAMLNAWLRNSTEDAQKEFLMSLALQLGGKAIPTPNLPLTHRLTKLVDRLNEMHYQARWEAGLNGPKIILGHCPYAAIITSHTELCRMDAFLQEQWTGLPVEQTAKLQVSINGHPYCLFRISGNRRKQLKDGDIIFDYLI